MLTHLCGVHLSLNNVENGNVAMIGLTVSACGHHDILGLQESPHHIKNCSLPHTCHLKRLRKILRRILKTKIVDTKVEISCLY